MGSKITFFPYRNKTTYKEMQIWSIPSSSHFILQNKIKAQKKCSVPLLFQNAVPPFLKAYLSHRLGSQFSSLMPVRNACSKGVAYASTFACPLKAEQINIGLQHLSTDYALYWNSAFTPPQLLATNLGIPICSCPPFGTGLSIVGLFPYEISLILFSVLCSWLSRYKVTEL